MVPYSTLPQLSRYRFPADLKAIPAPTEFQSFVSSLIYPNSIAEVSAEI